MKRKKKGTSFAIPIISVKAQQYLVDQLEKADAFLDATTFQEMLRRKFAPDFYSHDLNDYIAVNYDDFLLKPLSEFYCDVIDDATDRHVTVFSQLKNKKIAELNADLQKLQSEFLRSRSKELVAEIKGIIDTIKSLVKELTTLAVKALNRAKRNLVLIFSRNLRFFLRTIIQFLFKNMDDESHSAIALNTFVKSDLITVKFYNNAIQGKSHYSLK
jgi:hypothetical protein